ncbi:hypothetical protein CALCODRAFT_505813 [Calocera cornea HHB12733]|uniref:NADAR domain-containing protein n=1 Tax=Calocera cornea HHB12733 TaxID=1353952 RepID=A0A165JKG3_9BASI|nr:hypothetical protein CALCODRAFT_505813 [Calocera cornea HHB12733]
MAMYAATGYAPSAYGSTYQSGWNAATTYPATAGTMVPYNQAPYLGTVELYNALGTTQYPSSRRPWSHHRMRSTIEFNDWDSSNPYWILSTAAPLPLYDEQGRYYATAAHLFQSRKMEWVLHEKLRQHPQFRDLLLNTGRAYLLNDDYFWGIGSGRGRNELGRALMRLRKEL